ncbi:hypothetical protein SAMN05880501_110114 [Ureibacillus xyleni]|uniref:Uncharacterized protein n=1 Tax=Ureibacillus xyleni TaxID=614648 RepID=A0A285TA89_9BACL|nr:hypothetical protein SAMN05880501_110114 [Ureibacillus xyleni]
MNENDFTYDWKEITSIIVASSVLTSLIFAFTHLFY